MTEPHDIELTKHLLAAATPGEWNAPDSHGQSSHVCTENSNGRNIVHICCGWLDDFPGQDAGKKQNTANAKLIAHLHNTAAAVCDELAANRQTITELERANDGGI